MSLLHLHLSKKAQLTAIDRAVMVAAVAYPLTTLPQVYQIFTSHTAAGVSLFSWLGFVFFGTIFLTYAIAHRLKALIVTEILWLIVDVLVVVGVLMYQ